MESIKTGKVCAIRSVGYDTSILVSVFRGRSPCVIIGIRSKQAFEVKNNSRKSEHMFSFVRHNALKSRISVRKWQTIPNNDSVDSNHYTCDPDWAVSGAKR